MTVAAAARLTPSRAVAVLGGLSVCLFVAALLALAFGESSLDLGAALSDPAGRERLVLAELRLPRVLLAAIIGGSLAVAGCALQALLRNPLADPFVLGVSGGAALGGTLSLAVGGAALATAFSSWAHATLPGPLAPVVGGLLAHSPTTIAALLGALAASVVVYTAGRFGDRLSTYGALLAGVVFNALASAAITFLKAMLPPERLSDLVYWLAGALDYPEWSSVAGIALFEALGVGLVLYFAADLNLLSLGDEGAASLGVEVERVRRLLFLGTSLCVAAAVAVTGLVGFVGLIVPHLLRLWLGPDQRLLLPASAVGGAFFLVLADLLARVLFRPLGTATPVGVLTALIGGPAFLWMLRRLGKAMA
ncbi:MAG: iron ABC transporter permease [Myxococcales bacterium]